MIKLKGGDRTKENTLDVLSNYEYELYSICSNLTFYRDISEK